MDTGIERTEMPAEQFDALLESLNVPDDAPALADAAGRPRRFVAAPESSAPN